MQFERKFVSRMEALVVGDPLDDKTELGPLANADAVTSLDADVQKTVEAGARLVTGGHPLKRPGNFYAPTVLTNIPKNSPAYREEFFGPVASIFRVKNLDEAIRIANDSRFGLGASAWTQDDARTRTIHQRARSRHGVHQQDGGLRSTDAVWRREAVRAMGANWASTAFANSRISRPCGFSEDLNASCASDVGIW